MDEQITREMLYEEVWTYPASKVAVHYGISGVALAKVCRKHKIPLPPRGYWAKIKAGRTPRHTPLPRAKEFDNCSLPLSRPRGHGRNNDQLPNATPTTALERIGAVEVPEHLTAPHPLIRAASKRLKRKTGWNDLKGLRSAPNEVFHLEVTKSALDRALLIADTLIKELEKRDIKTRIDQEKQRTVIDVGTVSLALKVSEHVARTKHEATTAEKRAIKRWERSPNRWNLEIPLIPQFDFTPTGNLSISVGGYPSKSWHDTPKTSLENRLHQVIAGTLDLAEKRRCRAEEQERRRLAREKAIAEYRRKVELRKTEQEQLDQLKLSANKWQEAERLRRYIDAVDKSATENGGLTPGLKQWIVWARLKADCIDPLVPVSDVILDSPEPSRPGYLYS